TDARDGAVDQGSPAATCPTVPALMDIPPPGQSGTSGAISVGSSENILLSGGAASTGSTFFYFDPVAMHAAPIFGPGFPVSPSVSTLAAQAPGGSLAAGIDTNSRAILCGESCFELG